jgi:hypothetical protein
MMKVGVQTGKYWTMFLRILLSPSPKDIRVPVETSNLTMRKDSFLRNRALHTTFIHSCNNGFAATIVSSLSFFLRFEWTVQCKHFPWFGDVIFADPFPYPQYPNHHYATDHDSSRTQLLGVSGKCTEGAGVNSNTPPRVEWVKPVSPRHRKRGWRFWGVVIFIYGILNDTANNSGIQRQMTG